VVVRGRGIERGKKANWEMGFELNYKGKREKRTFEQEGEKDSMMDRIIYARMKKKINICLNDLNP